MKIPLWLTESFLNLLLLIKFATTYSLVPNNFVQPFSTPNIISVIILGIALGVALISYKNHQDYAQNTMQF